MNLKEQIQELKDLVINISIDISTEDGLSSEIETGSKRIFQIHTNSKKWMVF